MENLPPSVIGRCLCGLLEELRRERRLTQEEVARRLQVPPSFVAKIETGSRHVRVIELPELCGVLGVRPVDFMARLEDRLRVVTTPAAKRSSAERSQRRI